MPSSPDPDRRYRVAMVLRALGAVLLVLGFLGSIVWVRTPKMEAVVAVNTAGFLLMVASLWLRRMWFGVALFLILGVTLVAMQAGLR